MLAHYLHDMRLATLALLLVATPAVAGGVEHTTAEYTAAYARARSYALAHPGEEKPLSCRRAIGARAASVVVQRCLDVSASSRNRCMPRDGCEDVVQRLTWHCLFWKGDVPCVYLEDGGEVRQPSDRIDWRAKPAKS
ncbi:hypothetical protein BHAOGJBA_0608 [Methylobacterium hispanicum]|uniref:Uncharacterized protein n=2 Tax=Methylobacterium hispanicum TaxID=270350 RepID=A0AAV4ZGS7_9HYPH|nr:hypothetical protein BHAOGJBA_0608 [Methylobacterium hispanicum]